MIELPEHRTYQCPAHEVIDSQELFDLKTKHRALLQRVVETELHRFVRDNVPKKGSVVASFISSSDRDFRAILETEIEYRAAIFGARLSHFELRDDFTWDLRAVWYTYQCAEGYARAHGRCSYTPIVGPFTRCGTCFAPRVNGYCAGECDRDAR